MKYEEQRLPVDQCGIITSKQSVTESWVQAEREFTSLHDMGQVSYTKTQADNTEMFCFELVALNMITAQVAPCNTWWETLKPVETKKCQKMTP